MSPSAQPPRVVTVTLNPAIDRTVAIRSFTPGVVNRTGQASDRPGGKGVNVAAALARYGVPVVATGFLGADNAAPFEAAFAQLGITDRFVRLPGETRTGIKIVDPVAQETTDINFPGLTPSLSDLTTLLRQVEELAADGADWFVLAGSLPPGVPTTFYRDLIALIHERGCRVALDTSGEPLRLAIDAAPDLIKPNIHELADILNQPLHSQADVVAAARHIVDRGVGLVAVSMGSEGACLVNNSEVVRAYPPAIAVRSTVGAGDAMVAGLVASRLRSASLIDGARLATAFALHALTSREPDNRDAPHEIDTLVLRVTASGEPQPAAP